MSSEYKFIQSKLFTKLLHEIRTGNTDGVEELSLEYPYLFKLQQSNGDTPLHVAVREGQEKMVSALIEKEICNLSAKNKENQTPLEVAKQGNLQSITAILVAAEETLNSTEFSPEEEQIILQCSSNFFHHSVSTDKLGEKPKTDVLAQYEGPR